MPRRPQNLSPIRVIAPGREAPLEPPRNAADAVKRMVRSLAADVAEMDYAAMRALMPALEEARKELRAGIKHWLERVPEGTNRYTASEHRRALVSVERAMEAIVDIEPDMAKVLTDTSDVAGHLSVRHLEFELARMHGVFGGLGIMPTQVSDAAVIATGRKERIRHYRTSSARYSQAVREDIRKQFGVGLAKGETFSQLGNRLQRLGGPRGQVALRGIAGERGAIVESISEGLFARYRHWADRMVRTEVINAYNSQHAAAIDELNDGLVGGEESYGKRWDSSMDSRLCRVCAGLDRVTVGPGELFPGHIAHPPAHPNCRCTVVAWHPSWVIKGAPAKSRSDVDIIPIGVRSPGHKRTIKAKPGTSKGRRLRPPQG